MSLNYGTLKTEILTLAHRPDLTSEVAGFVRRAEGMIKRDLVGYILSATMDDDDRDDSSTGVYTAPTGLLQVRAIFGTDGNGLPYSLDKVGIDAIKSLSASAPPIYYTMRGNDSLEIRGIPAESSSFDVEYFGHPAIFSSDGDENDLLTDHEHIYIEAALFELYKFTQDLELAQASLDTWTNAVETLNQQIGRRLGGAQAAGHYNLGLYMNAGGY